MRSNHPKFRTALNSLSFRPSLDLHGSCICNGYRRHYSKELLRHCVHLHTIYPWSDRPSWQLSAGQCSVHPQCNSTFCCGALRS